MKKAFLLITILAVTAGVHAQSNLQLSQALRYKATGNYTNQTPATVGTITVPTGMMYKIESAYAVSTGTPSCSLTVDGQLVFASYDTPGYVSLPVFPIWLGPGSYTVVFTNLTSNAGTFTCTAIVSGLEFNLVP
jgi:hypothetical protein